MSESTIVPLAVFISLSAAVFVASFIRERIDPVHRSSEAKDSIKLAMGLVSTMAALLLGLLVASAKGTYDTSTGEIGTVAGKFAFLGRLLSDYGPEADPIRRELGTGLQFTMDALWTQGSDARERVARNIHAGNRIFSDIESLQPQNPVQASIKAQAIALALQVGEIRAHLLVESSPSVAQPLLIVVVAWLFIIFFSFTFLAPQSASAHIALVLSAAAVAGAIFLILELEHPFEGLLQISKEPMEIALRQIVG